MNRPIVRRIGDTPTPTYMTWKAMRQRCRDPKAWNYQYYGGKGVTVDPRWNDYALFLEDMGDRPDGMTLDRIDSGGNYTKSNCRWSTVIVQRNNMGRRKDAKLMTIDGVERTVPEWARISGVPVACLYGRFRTGKTGKEFLRPTGKTYITKE